MPEGDSGIAAMNIVISNMQQRAAQSGDRVSTSLKADQTADNQRHVDNTRHMAEWSTHNQLRNMHQNSGLVAAMNESANANNYISSVSESHNAQVLKSTQDVNREQSLVSRHLLDYVYQKDRYVYGVHIIQMAIFVIAVLLLCGVLWSMERLDVISTVLIAGATIAVFVIYVIVQMAYLGRRRREAGRKMAFSVTGQMETEMARLLGNSGCR